MIYSDKIPIFEKKWGVDIEIDSSNYYSDGRWYYIWASYGGMGIIYRDFLKDTIEYEYPPFVRDDFVNEFKEIAEYEVIPSPSRSLDEVIKNLKDLRAKNDI